jgi:hypothetical protein
MSAKSTAIVFTIGIDIGTRPDEAEAAIGSHLRDRKADGRWTPGVSTSVGF